MKNWDLNSHLEFNMAVPKLRFPGFDGEWEKLSISEIADRYDNLRIPVTAANRIKGDTPYYGANGIQDYVTGYTHDGEYVLIAEDGANDLENYPSFCTNGKIWVNNHTHVLQGKTGLLDNNYLSLAIKKADIKNVLVGGGRAKLTADSLMKLKLFVPSLEEQKKIGLFFTEVDNNIALNEEKLTELQDLKKSLLQKMFPKTGETVPEIRFPGFDGEWECKKVNDVFNTITDYVAAGSFADLNKNVQYNNIPDFAQLIRTFDLKNGFVGPDKVYINEHAFNYLHRVNLNQASIVLPNIGNCGEVYYVTPDIFPHKNNVLGPNAILVRSNEQNNLFLSFCLKNSVFQKQLSLIISPTGQSKFNKTELKDLNIFIPSLEEQQKIGSFFKELDNHIELQKEKLKEIKEYKKGLLQQMFC